MKKLLLLALMSSSAIANSNDPVTQAVNFNSWYVSQIAQDKSPVNDDQKIDNYVTTETLQKLRRTQDPAYDDEEFYEADLFLKAQDIGDDWPQNVSAIAGDTDPVCVNVYIAFGKKQDHIVIDCMVKEKDIWKVQSVANVNFSRNLNNK